MSEIPMNRPATKGERQSAETALSAEEEAQVRRAIAAEPRSMRTSSQKTVARLLATLDAARAALPASTEDVERLGRLAATPISRWRSTDQEWFVESFPIEFIEGHDWDVDYREFARWLAVRLGAASGGVPAALDVAEGTIAHRVADNGHVFGSHIEGIEGSGSGFLSRVAYNVPDGTRVRVTVARSASEPAGSAPSSSSEPEAPGLAAAARNVVDKAEPDDNFDGEFVDFLVPFEAIEALKAALAAKGAAGQPAGTTNP